MYQYVTLTALVGSLEPGTTVADHCNRENVRHIHDQGGKLEETPGGNQPLQENPHRNRPCRCQNILSNRLQAQVALERNFTRDSRHHWTETPCFDLSSILVCDCSVGRISLSKDLIMYSSFSVLCGPVSLEPAHTDDIQSIPVSGLLLSALAPS